MPKPRGLGRGLDALIPPVTVAGEEIRQIRMEEIRPNPRQARTEWDEEELNALAASIAEYGLLHPVVVRPVEGGYELVAGERRWRACQRLGWETIPALVRSYDDLATACALLVENLHRRELNPLEEATAYRRLIEEFGLTQEEVARRVGKSRAAVTNTLRLLNLSPLVLQLLREGQLTAGHARALLALPRAEEQELFALKAVKLGMSVRALEEAIQRYCRSSSATASPEDPEVKEKLAVWSQAWGARVSLRPGKRSWRLELVFPNREAVISFLAGTIPKVSRGT